MSSWRVLAVVACATLLAAGCTTPRSGRHVDLLLEQGLDASRARAQRGDSFEAYQLARAVERVDPDYPGVQDALTVLPAELEDVFHRPLLGSNVAVREPVDAAWWEHVLWYLPDRVLDLLDIVSFDVHLGFGLWVDVHATRAAQVALGARSVGGLGWHTQRSLGVRAQTQAGISLLPFGAEGYGAYTAGTSGARGGSWSESGLHNPSSSLYQDEKDYWAVGGSVTAVVAGVDFDVHLMQIADFVAGVLTFDLLNDDFASSRGLDLEDSERKLLRHLGEVAGNATEKEAYQRWRDGQRAREEEASRAANQPATPAPEPVDDGAEDPAPDDGPESDTDEDRPAP